MRRENKYLVALELAEETKKKIKDIGQRDVHIKQNYYIITNEYIAFWKSKNCRGKIRIRSYDNCTYLEFKYKINENQFKERVEIDKNTYFAIKKIENPNDLLLYLKQNFSKFDLKFIDNLYLCNFNVQYNRDAWEIMYKSNRYRVTFDTEIKSNERQVITGNLCLIEIKGLNNEIIENLLNLTPYKVKISKFKVAKKVSMECN